MSVERRGQPMKPSERDTSTRHRAGIPGITKRSLIAKRAQENPKLKFSALMHHFSERNLEVCFHQLNGNKAVGADGVTKEEYGRNLQFNLKDLVNRLKRFSYRPKPVRRVEIPKGDGQFRSLGISCFEDKLLQTLVKQILESIYEQDFLDFSYGFRPKRGCHMAVRSVYKYLYPERRAWVVEIDIQSYFDSIGHGWLMKCLEQRVSDPKFLRLIGRMLKCGVLDKGEFHKTDQGSPQGSIVSPVLSNIFLHYVLDIWFDRVGRKEMREESGLRRYADDAVAFFRSEQDATHFVELLKRRFEKFGLVLHPTKTRIIHFDRDMNRSGVFEFLGFRYYWGRTAKGFRTIKCETSSKRLRAKVNLFKQWIKANRNLHRLPVLWEKVTKMLRGHYAYYGVSWNSRQLSRYQRECYFLLYKWLNRRSQRRSFTLSEFNAHLERNPLPKPRITVALY